MGQVALGLRSMAFKLSVFVVMAAMLAWILGGTLFPRPVIGYQQGMVQTQGHKWRWQSETLPATGQVNWYLVRIPDLDLETPWQRVAGGGPWAAVEALQAIKAVPDGDVMFRTRVWTRASGDEALTLIVRRDGTARLDQSVATAD